MTRRWLMKKYKAMADLIIPIQPLTEREIMFGNGSQIKMNFKVVELVNIIKANWKQHALDYTEAMVQFKKEYSERLDAIKADAEKTGTYRQSVGVREPMSFESDYKRAVEMLELSCDEEITLDESTYDRLVNDNWEWKRSFLDNTVAYLNK